MMRKLVLMRQILAKSRFSDQQKHNPPISVNRVPRAELEDQEVMPYSGCVAGRFSTQRGFGWLAPES